MNARDLAQLNADVKVALSLPPGHPKYEHAASVIAAGLADKLIMPALITAYAGATTWDGTGDNAEWRSLRRAVLLGVQRAMSYHMQPSGDSQDKLVRGSVRLIHHRDGGE